MLLETLDKVFEGEWLKMAGSQKTNEYVVMAGTSRGRIGVRRLPCGQCGTDHFRVRIEPANKKAAASIAKGLTPAEGWKQPGDEGQFRFSKMVDTLDDLGLVVKEGFKPLKGRTKDVLVNPELPEFLQGIL